MGLYHSVALGYGFAIPTTTDPDDIDRSCFGQEYGPDGVGYIVVGDHDQMLLVTRCVSATENTVTPITADMATAEELAAWDAALHTVAARIGLADHEPPSWLLIHNYR